MDGYPSLSCSLPTILFVDGCGGPGGRGGAFQIPVPELCGAVVNREQGPWRLSAPAWGTEVVSGARADSVPPRRRLRSVCDLEQFGAGYCVGIPPVSVP